ncbi:hypothetical protein [Nocardioides alpinus]|nr:hypothetical protein [Nocardioides alpinus]
MAPSAPQGRRVFPTAAFIHRGGDCDASQMRGYGSVMTESPQTYDQDAEPTRGGRMTTYGNEPLTNEPLTGTATSGTQTSGTQTSGTTDKAKEAASTAAAQGQHVAGTAKDEALNVAGTATEQARNVLGDAKQHVSAQVSDQAVTQRDQLSQTLRTFGDDLQQMVEQGPDAGLASDLTREVSDRVRALGTHLQDREPGQLLDDARDFARRRPGTFLIGALAAGVVAGRLFRATADGAAAAELADAPASTTTRTTPVPATATDAIQGVGTPTPAGPPQADFAAAPPTLADPAPLSDPTTSGTSSFAGQPTRDTP